MTNHLDMDLDDLAAFCQRYQIAKLSLFGSVLRDDFDPSRSDVDVLIEFGPGANKSLFAIVRMQDELADIFKRRVHVCTAGSLSKYFRDEVVAEAEEQYVEA